MPSITPASASHITNPVSFNDWVVYWETTPSDGIRIYNVTYKGVPVLRDARVPGVIVQYFGGTSCFFYDQFSISHSNVFLEDVTRGSLDPSDQGFQIRGDYYVPGYLYEGTWRFYPDGKFLGLVEIGGGGCIPYKHAYTVRFRFDLAVGEDNRNSFYQYANGGWTPVRQESELVDSGERDPSKTFTNWKVSSGRKAYHFTPFDTPDSQWAPGLALVVQNHPNEIENSPIPGIVTPYIYRGIVVYDSDGDSVYDLLEPAMAGTSPTLGMALEGEPKVKYNDANGNNRWDSGEAAVYDSNTNGRYDTGEPVIFGTAPTAGTTVKPDPKFKSTPSESVWRKDIVVWYMSRHYHDPTIEYQFETPVQTGLVFYPTGY